ncbi:unnamed protein product [Blepharisma stoltei]|uniref:Uncharacterized protein n=1 Tax=Blepharisma stoltei TaxID=1481888 RepID=A0AAU9JCB3_9CILI|nr:unnamed protein product [Blepharisma stoltei]
MINLSDSLEFESTGSNKHSTDQSTNFPQKYTPRSTNLDISNLSSTVEPSFLEKDSQNQTQVITKNRPGKFFTRNHSEIPIEAKLYQKQIAASKRLEDLKKKREEELKGLMQKKPKISKKSQELAKRVEIKLFSQIPLQIDEKNTKIRNNDENETFIHKQNDFSNSKPQEKSTIFSNISNTPSKSPFLREKERSLSSQTPFFKDIPQHQKSSPSGPIIPLDISVIKPIDIIQKQKLLKKKLLNLSVIDRNQTWLKQKNEKISIQVSEKENSFIEECTFSPVIYSRVPHKLQKTSAKELHRISKSKCSSANISMIGSTTLTRANSIMSPLNSDCSRSRKLSSNNGLLENPKPAKRYASLTPCQIKISFKAGCDIENFYCRAR